MERLNVESSNIVSVGYEEQSQVLEVEFKAVGVYRYFGVPKQVYEGLMMAPSKGQYLNRYVKSAGYAFERIGRAGA